MKVNKAQLEELLASNKNTIVVDFYADWCGPCKMLGPVLKEIDKENDDITVVKINIDEEINYAVASKVIAVPTIVVYKNGVETNRATGFMPKQEVLEVINK